MVYWTKTIMHSLQVIIQIFILSDGTMWKLIYGHILLVRIICLSNQTLQSVVQFIFHAFETLFLFVEQIYSENKNK